MFKFLFKILTLSKQKKWKDIEYFDPVWKDRIQMMAKLIPSNKKVLDLGCGEMWTKQFLQDGCTYYPVDYTNRGNQSIIICNFNKYEFPEIEVDFCFVSGCLEYVSDFEWFIKQISNVSQSCVISYCTLEKFPDLQKRKNRTWSNHLTKDALIKQFLNVGFKLIHEDITNSNNTIFLFNK